MEERNRTSKKEPETDRAESRKGPGHRGEEDSSSTAGRGGDSNGSRGAEKRGSSSTKKK